MPPVAPSRSGDARSSVVETGDATGAATGGSAVLSVAPRRSGDARSGAVETGGASVGAHGAARTPRLPGVDFLRGVACLLVFFYHVGMYWHGAFASGWAPVIAASGWLSPLVWVAREGLHGVSLFLVLSGFCLHHPLAASGAPLRLGVFWRRRAIRILPAYYASLAILAAAVLSGGALAWAMFPPLEAWDVGVHVLLVHNLHARTIWSLNGAYWSLALEWQLYLIFPLLVLLARRAPALLLAGSALGAWFGPALLGRAFPVLHASPAWWAVGAESVVGHLFEFACGMVAAELLARGRVPPKGVLLLLASAMIPVLYAVDVAHALPVPAQRLACGVSFASLVLLVGPSSLGGGWVRRALLFPGVVSYSLYLVHQPILLVLRPWVWRLGWSSTAAFGLAALVVLPASLAVAKLFHAAFEAPFLPGGRLRRLAG